MHLHSPRFFFFDGVWGWPQEKKTILDTTPVPKHYSPIHPTTPPSSECTVPIVSRGGLTVITTRGEVEPVFQLEHLQVGKAVAHWIR